MNFAVISLLLVGASFAAPKNIILMIGDGMGAEHVRATAFYLYGKDSTILDSFSEKGWMSTFSVSGGFSPDSAASDATYVSHKPTDSAASSTAFSTGEKTYDAAIGVDSLGLPLLTITEAAAFIGKSTGVITSVPFSHATPAGMAAHQLGRSSYARIAEEMIFYTKLDVILGGGHPHYDPSGQLKEPGLWDFDYSGGPAVWDKVVSGTAISMEGTPWTFTQSKGYIDSLAKGKTIPPKNLLGVMPVYETLQQRRATIAEYVNREPNPGFSPKNTNVPSLTNMVLAGLRVLNQNPAGFFVMIEGGAIDWAAHNNLSARMIEETADFLDAVLAVRDWVEDHGGWENNLVIVTSDHETGYLSNPAGRATPVLNMGKGNLPTMEWFSTGHTNQLVPIKAQGNSAELIMKNVQGIDPTRGPYTDNALVGKFLHSLFQAKWEFASVISP